jgi:hypothetical protein
MKRILSSLVAALALSLGLQALAKPMLLDGNVTTSRVQNLATQIPWNRSVNAAENEASKEGKMVFWVHMLGDMTGAT